MTERLISCALIRAGKIESRGFKEHWRIRAALGDENPHEKNPADQYGFMTSDDRFVDRDEARQIGIASGQLGRGWKDCRREVLSSDIDWDATP